MLGLPNAITKPRSAASISLSATKRTGTVLVAAIAYGGFLTVVLWAIAFVANVDVLTTIDGPARSSWRLPAVTDLALLGLFALHHSLMARARAKRLVTRLVPSALERSSYVLTADALLALVFWKWQPVDSTLWDIHAQPWRDLTWAAYGLGWVISAAATFMIDHFDLLGVRQAVSQPGSYAPPTFQIRWLYRRVRHPLMLGLLVAFWLTPTMSAGHLLFAVAATGYIVIGVRFEERDLRRDLGAPYLEYASRVPAILPRPIGKQEPVL